MAGVCSPSPCTQTAKAGFTLTNVPDSSAAPFGSSTPKLANRVVQIERPGNLQATPAPPVFIVNSSPVGTQPDWQAAAAKFGFVFVQLQAESNGLYHAPTVAWDAGLHGQSQTCGVSGGDLCSSIPYVKQVIQSIECPYTGSGTCQGVNPNEVYMSGFSANGLFMEGVGCDSRTSTLISGVQVVSDKMQSPTRINGGIPASQANALPPNCPSEFGAQSHCFEDCSSPPQNHNLSWQYTYGTVDSTAGSSGGSCTINNANDCLGNGFFFTSLPDNWYGGVKWDAGTLLTTAEGCDTSPTNTTTIGQTNQVTQWTYLNCTNTHSAVQIDRIAFGAHGPDAWPCGPSSTGASAYANLTASSWCTTGGGTVDQNSSDGVNVPAAAYRFFSTHPGAP